MAFISKEKSPVGYWKVKMCLALLTVNVFLIAGIFVSATRRVRDQRLSAIVHLRLMERKTIPGDVQLTVAKVHRYLQSISDIDNNQICDVAWKFDSAENSTDFLPARHKSCSVLWRCVGTRLKCQVIVSLRFLDTQTRTCLPQTLDY